MTRRPLDRHEVLAFAAFAAIVALILLAAFYGWHSGAWEPPP